MTRNLFIACLLLSGAALATGWALAPVCDGSSGLGSGFTTGADQDGAGVGDAPGPERGLLGGNAQVPALAAASKAARADQIGPATAKLASGILNLR